MSDDSDDEYFLRLQDNAPADVFEASHDLGHVTSHSLPRSLSEEEYYDLLTDSESTLIAAEDDIVWQDLLRRQAFEGVSSIDEELLLVHSESAMMMLKQFLSSYLPLSARMFGLVRHWIARPKRLCPADETEERFLCDNVVHPSFVMRLESAIGSSSCEVAIFAPEDLSPKHWETVIQYLHRKRMFSIQLSGWDSLLAERFKSRLVISGARINSDIGCVLVSLLDPFRQLESFKELGDLPEGYDFCGIM